MSTLTLQLDRVDWRAVAAVCPSTAQSCPRVLADALSLSALFVDDYQEGLDRVERARDSEPLNPIHDVRKILLILRFGQSGRALELSHQLEEKLPGFALPAYLQALAAHREGEYRRSANVAAEVVTAHRAFTPARFLQTESQLHTQFKGLRKLLTDLPRDQDHASFWLDLTAKLILSGNEEGKALAREIAGDTRLLPAGSRERELAQELIELSNAGLEELEGKLAALAAGSRAEELLLLFYLDRLREESSLPSAVEALRQLSIRLADRRAVRRVYVARLTRLAIELAVAEKFAAALRVVERCLTLEPHETVHYQNRAALFTLLREPAAYHDAWYELERHQFRLALLGRVTAADAAALARPHRLFAQQARLPTEGPMAQGGGQNRCFLMEAIRANEATGAIETTLAVNHERIQDDPELLRQWVHHRRAELVFAHWALGHDPRRFLLDPDNMLVFRSRMTALVSCARSLQVLVPEEGQLLAGRFVAFWTQQAGSFHPTYALVPEDQEARALKLLHLETSGDLALLCLTWKPDRDSAGLVEEVLALLQDEGPFFDEAILQETLSAKQVEAGYPLKLLSGFMKDALGLDPSLSRRLSDSQRSSVIGRLAAELLTRLAYRTYEEERGTQFSAGRALAYVDRARLHDPGNIRTELTATRFLLIAGHDDEARATLAQLHRSARAREPEIHAEIDELRRILDERGSSGVVGHPRAGGAVEVVTPHPTGAQVADLETEIDRFPGSIQASEELVRKLVADGQFQDAVDWTERAMTQCLGRDGQLRARSLNLEVLGLWKLGARDQKAVQLYATGAHGRALEVLEAIPDSEAIDYTVHFLHGRCLLAVGRTEDARLAFERALEGCGRQLHRTVLRGLAMDVDQPYFLVARRSIADALEAGEVERGLRETWTMMLHLRRPEVALIDLAQIHLDAAVARVGTPNEALPGPTSQDLAALFGGRLAEVYASNSDLERARRLARLGLEAHPPSGRKAELILRKAEALEVQAALAEVLVRAGNLVREGNFVGALTALEDAGPAGATEPRVVRQRALLLLKLERFQEAEAAAAALRGIASALAKEFLDSFPALAVRQRIAAASRLLRAGESASALAILDGAVASEPDQIVELAYCRGFGLTMDAYRLRRAREEAGARDAFKAALEHVEPVVATARASGHTRLIELYETLDKELDHGF